MKTIRINVFLRHYFKTYGYDNYISNRKHLYAVTDSMLTLLLILIKHHSEHLAITKASWKFVKINKRIVVVFGGWFSYQESPYFNSKIFLMIRHILVSPSLLVPVRRLRVSVLATQAPPELDLQVLLRRELATPGSCPLTSMHVPHSHTSCIPRPQLTSNLHLVKLQFLF